MDFDVEAVRKEFEDWKRTRKHCELTRCGGIAPMDYANNHTNGQWHAWLACARRAAQKERTARDRAAERSTTVLGDIDRAIAERNS